MATADTAPAEPQAFPAPPVQRRSAGLPAQPRATPPTGPPGTSKPPGTAGAPGQAHTATLIGSVQRAMRLLEAAAGHEHGAPAKQLARETGLALPTAYHLLRTLVHEGYLRRDRGLFFLGTAAERLSSGAAAQKHRSTVAATLARWRDSVGAPVYYAIYREGEIEVLCVSDTPGNPAVEEWADFRETAHAHAIGQCLLSQLDEDARRDHLHRYPVQPLTPYTVRDNDALLRRRDRGLMPGADAGEFRAARALDVDHATAGDAAPEGARHFIFDLRPGRTGDGGELAMQVIHIGRFP